MNISLFFAFLALISPYASKQMENSYNTFINDFNNYICQKEEEHSKEEEIVYEPSPEEIALSLPQDDYALYIPAINCSIKVHLCDTDEEIRASQYWVDLKNYGTDVRYDLAYGDAVSEAYRHISFIADHSDQGFYGLWSLPTGAKAYVAKGSTVKLYELTSTYHAYMQYTEYDHVIAQVPLFNGQNLMLGDADLIMMTCAEDSNIGGRYITYWKERS